MSGQKIHWFSRKMVDVIHFEVIREFGGSYGIRDEGAIEAALARPKNKKAYEDCDLVVLAGAYGYGLCKNHGFVDGNKRVAFSVIATFLHRHGYLLEASEPEAALAMEEVAAGHWSEDALIQWLRDNILKI